MSMKLRLATVLTVLLSWAVQAQVGINTTTPNTSAALDIESTEGGVLIPRMTTTERDEISDPATSLLIYDTVLDGYFFNQGTPASPDWVKLLTKENGRDNYVIVKSVADFPGGGGGGTITLDENTLYEVNGLITMSQSIELNNAYLIGNDANEDILNYVGSGSLFTGSTGGSMRNLTYNGSFGSGSLFGLSGNLGENIIIQSSVVSGFNSVGTISNYGLIFLNVVNYLGNSDGVTYSNIGNLLLNNQGWADGNGGAYETFEGTFGFIQKVSGFSTVSSGAIGIDVSGNPTVGNGAMSSTVFNGAGDYVLPYTSGQIYPGYNFNNDWEVDCAGIPFESDDNAAGTIYIQRNSAGDNPSFSIASSTSLQANIVPGTLYRFSNTTPQVTGTQANGGNNVLVYEGKEPRTFSVRGNLAYQPTTNTGTESIHAFYVRRYSSNGTAIEIPLGSEVYSAVGAATNANDGDFLIRGVPLIGKITMNPGDYIRVQGQRINGTRNDIRVYSISLTLD